MINFHIDYSEGAHPQLMQALLQTNELKTVGYGEDDYCQQAIELLKNRLNFQACEIHFLIGGTQTNLTLISHALRPFESVISASSGHIAVNETGAIEMTGHKVISIPTRNGKLTPNLIEESLTQHHGVHMVQPKMVYLTNPTELGTLYQKAELQAIKDYCEIKQLYLYLDGARLSSALTVCSNDIQLSDYPRLTDAFYIGGTKCGALFGEALVITHPLLQSHFRFSMKQKGALLAKGRLLGLQFYELFKDNLYYDLGTKANEMAMSLQVGLAELGISFLVPPQSNQLFPIFPNDLIDYLKTDYSFLVHHPYDEDSSVLRLIASWSTTSEEINTLLRDINQFQLKKHPRSK